MAQDEQHLESPDHDQVRDQYDDVEKDGLFEEGMARMALYHRHCQDPVIFQALGNIRGKSLLDLACGNGFYTRRFRAELGADPVVGIDLSPGMIAQAKDIERKEPLGIEYRVGDAMQLSPDRSYDVVTAIHLLHYLESEAELGSTLAAIYNALVDNGIFVTMVANPDFDLTRHDQVDSREKFGYYFSAAETGNGGLFRFHPGGFEKERELTFEFRRWERAFLDRIANSVGFVAEWRDPFISKDGLEEYGSEFFENYIHNPQSKLIRMTKQG